MLIIVCFEIQVTAIFYQLELYNIIQSHNDFMVTLMHFYSTQQVT